MPCNTFRARTSFSYHLREQRCSAEISWEPQMRFQNVSRPHWKKSQKNYVKRVCTIYLKYYVTMKSIFTKGDLAFFCCGWPWQSACSNSLKSLQQISVWTSHISGVRSLRVARGHRPGQRRCRVYSLRAGCPWSQLQKSGLITRPGFKAQLGSQGSGDCAGLRRTPIRGWIPYGDEIKASELNLGTNVRAC